MGTKAEIEETKRTALLIGGGALGIYLLAKSGFLEGAFKGGMKEVYERFVESVKEMFPENWQDLFPELNHPSLPAWWPEWWPDTGGNGNGNGVIPTDGDGISGFATNLQTTLLRAGGVYARQLGGIAIRGKGLPGLWVPGGRAVSGLRLGARAVTAGGRIMPKAVSPLRSVLDDLAGRGISRFVGETAAKRAFPGFTERAISAAGAKVAWKTGVPTVAKHVLPRLGAGVAARAGLRAIPAVGWGLTVVDAFADIARIMGIDVTEWLGFSGIASPFMGSNPLERLFGRPLVTPAAAAPLWFSAPGVAARVAGFGYGEVSEAPTYRPPSTLREFGLERIGFVGGVAPAPAPAVPSGYTPGEAKIYEHY